MYIQTSNLEKQIPSDIHLTIYTDGACSGNPGPGAFAIIILNSMGTVLHRHQAFENNTTSNRMELSALLWVLEYLSAPTMDIYSDSNYVVQGINNWLVTWKKKSWNTTAGPVKNLDLWQKIDLLLMKKKQKKEKFNLHWVKGHSNNIYNNEVDRIARATILRYNI